MFDDQPKDKSALNLQDLNQGKPNPFNKVDDSQPVSQHKLAGNKGPVEDIFSHSEGLDSSPSQNPIPAENLSNTQLKEPPQVPSMSQPVEPSMPTSSQVQNPSPAPASNYPPTIRPKNKLFMILLLVFIIVILGLGGVLAYQYFSKDKSPASSTPDQESNLPAGGLDGLLDIINNPPDQTDQNGANNDQTPPDQDNLGDDQENPPNNLIDSDNDGLTDEQEIELGTNPNKFDTDADGLNDFEEVEIYRSSPINSDTDGDSYLDGDEVEHGYDPLIPGSARL